MRKIKLSSRKCILNASVVRKSSNKDCQIIYLEGVIEQINNHFQNLNEITAVDKNYQVILKL